MLIINDLKKCACQMLNWSFNTCSKRFEELCFALPDEIPEGIYNKDADKAQDFQVSILSGPTEDMIAMATIDLEDIKALVKLHIVNMWFKKSDDRKKVIFTRYPFDPLNFPT